MFWGSFLGPPGPRGLHGLDGLMGVKGEPGARGKYYHVYMFLQCLFSVPLFYVHVLFHV